VFAKGNYDKGDGIEPKILRGQATRRDIIKGALKAGAYAAPIVAVGAVPFAVGAVTGPSGVTLLINGANTATLAGNVNFTLTGTRFTPGATIYRVAYPNFTGTGFAFSFLTTPLTIAANGTISSTENTGNVGAFTTNGPGSYTIAIATQANGSGFSGVLVSLQVTYTGGVLSGMAVPAGSRTGRGD